MSTVLHLGSCPWWVYMAHPGSVVGIWFIGCMIDRMQPAQATPSPLAQIVPQVDNPAAIAIMIALSWLMTRFTMEMLHCTALKLSEVSVVSVVSAVSAVAVRVLADVGGISCMTNRPATRARTMSFCACICIMESLQWSFFRGCGKSWYDMSSRMSRWIFLFLAVLSGEDTAYFYSLLRYLLSDR